MMYLSNVVKNWKSLKTENPETETKHYLHCLWLCIYFPQIYQLQYALFVLRFVNLTFSRNQNCIDFCFIIIGDIAILVWK